MTKRTKSSIKSAAAGSTLPRHTDSREFVRLACLACDSTCRFEDSLVENNLEGLCREALSHHDDSAIETALTTLKEDQTPAYDELLAMAEDCAQTIDCTENETGVHILVLVPILVWSRYIIPFGPVVNKKALTAVADLYRRYFASETARVVIGNCILSNDHLPEQLREVRKTLEFMIEGSPAHGSIVKIDKLLTETPSADFSDVRYLAIAASAPSAPELFASGDASVVESARAMMNFCLEARDIMRTPMAGSNIDVQPPASFFTAWRQSEAGMRTFALKSLVSFVSCSGFAVADLTVTVAKFVRYESAENEPDTEIRISVSRQSDLDRVVAGIVLPVLDEDCDSTVGMVQDILKICGVPRIVTLDHSFPMEWCPDCGAPMYATTEGHVAHIESPDSLDESAMPPTIN